VRWSRAGQRVLDRGAESGRSVVVLRHRKKKGINELIISDLRAEDEGVYTCTVSNSVGSVSHNITVRAERRVVAGPPEIQVNMPGNHSVTVGTNLTLQCRLTVPESSSVRWYRHFQVRGSMAPPPDSSCR
jgi:hypothetical protein